MNLQTNFHKSGLTTGTSFETHDLRFGEKASCCPAPFLGGQGLAHPAKQEERLSLVLLDDHDHTIIALGFAGVDPNQVCTFWQLGRNQAGII